MKTAGFTLAATTNDLTREPEVRDVADAVEFRMDKADDPVEQLSGYDGDLPILATNRGKWFGGEATDAGRLDRLFEAAEFDSVELVDIELETVRGTTWVLEEFRETDVGLVVSFHDFEETPDVDTLTAIFEESTQYGDVGKVATYATSYSDTLRMLEAVHAATSDGLCVAGISMGGVGSHTRAVAPLYGSRLGYAPLESDPSTYAPGQIPIRELASMVGTLTDAELRRDGSDGDGTTSPEGTTSVE